MIGELAEAVLALPSFAMIMIELYTGERLFKGLEVHQLMYLARPHPFASSASFFRVIFQHKGNIAQSLQSLHRLVI